MQLIAKLLPALCQAGEGGVAPDWIMLLPSGSIKTVDGRGPYYAKDPAGLAASSLQDAGGRLPIDENHATDLAAPQGGPSPARGWIVEIEPRSDGLWGHVEWSATGKQLFAERAYRFISPVIYHEQDGAVTRILRASLVNNANLRNMPALHMESNMDLLTQLRTALGLANDADAAAVVSAVTSLKGGAAMQAALAPIAKAAGLTEAADAGAVLQAVQSLADPSKRVPAIQVTALQQHISQIALAAGLQANAEPAIIIGTVKDLTDPAKHVPASQVAALQQQLTTLTTNFTKDKATTAVDAAIKAGKPGVAALKDHYIARHMVDPAAVDKEFAGLPSLTGPSGAMQTPPAKDKDGKPVLNAEQITVANLLGIKHDDYAKTLAAEAAA